MFQSSVLSRDTSNNAVNLKYFVVLRAQNDLNILRLNLWAEVLAILRFCEGGRSIVGLLSHTKIRTFFPPYAPPNQSGLAKQYFVKCDHTVHIFFGLKEVSGCRSHWYYFLYLQRTQPAAILHDTRRVLSSKHKDSCRWILEHSMSMV